jgi:hypothetical protein
MIDSFIFFGTALAIIFLLMTRYQYSAGLYIISAVIFAIMSIGIMGSGWETYSVPNFLITDTGATTTTVVAVKTTYVATIAANPIVFALGTFFGFLAFVLAILYLQEGQRNKLAKEFG